MRGGDGEIVSSPLGTGVVGLTVGALLGFIEGTAEGDGLGIEDGFGLGNDVVGRIVGGGMGHKDGTLVGKVEGVGVGIIGGKK